MTNHQTVWVYPHGKPEQAAEATVEIVSRNQQSIALRLGDKPEWCNIAQGVTLFDDYTGGIAMLLMRHDVVGPWVELTGGGHYEIEESKPDA